MIASLRSLLDARDPAQRSQGEELLAALGGVALAGALGEGCTLDAYGNLRSPARPAAAGPAASAGGVLAAPGR